MCGGVAISVFFSSTSSKRSNVYVIDERQERFKELISCRVLVEYRRYLHSSARFTAKDETFRFHACLRNGILISQCIV